LTRFVAIWVARVGSVQVLPVVSSDPDIVMESTGMLSSDARKVFQSMSYWEVTPYVTPFSYSLLKTKAGPAVSEGAREGTSEGDSEGTSDGDREGRADGTEEADGLKDGAEEQKND
jgi:hypothetical protein